MGIPIIRPFTSSDVESVREIHEKYYREEFNFPNFLANFICCFVVETDEGIITAGGIRNIAELVLVTDKSRSGRDRHKGLYQALDASVFVASKNGHDGIHAFVQDDIWEEVLRKVGFNPTKGKSLVIGI